MTQVRALLLTVLLLLAGSLWADTIRDIQAGVQTQGRLGIKDETLEDGSYYHIYRVHAIRGDQVTVNLESTDFDTYVYVIDDGDFREDNDDRTMGDTNSELSFEVDRPRDFYVVATSYEPGDIGEYRLLVSTERSVASAPVQATLAGINRDQGELEKGDERLSSGEFYDSYMFAGSTGQLVSLELESDEFDTYLILIEPDGEQIEIDDARGSTNSYLERVLEQEGTYEILVTSYEANETGRYTLVRSAGADVAAGRTAVTQPQPNQPAIATRPNQPTADPVRPSQLASAGYYGVFVGISDYPGTADDLDFCAADAGDLNRVFVQNGFATSDRVTLLQDRNATRSRMLGAIEEYAAQIRRDDTLVLFYSGHGDSVPSGRESDGTDETIELYDGPILDDELANALSSVQGRVILVLDACYSAGFAKDVISRPGWFGIFSSEEDVVSYVADEFRAGGYLSHFFQEAITGNADGSVGNGRDRRVSMAELERYLFTTWYGDGGPSADSNQHLRFERNGVSVDEVLFRL